MTVIVLYRHWERQSSKEIWKTAIKQVADVSEMLERGVRWSTKVIVLKLKESSMGTGRSSELPSHLIHFL